MAFAVENKLSNFSKNDKPWVVHSREKAKISSLYAEEPRFSKLSARMNECADYVEFGKIDPRHDPKKRNIKLLKAHFCRVRLCPVCAWRKSLALIARFKRNLPHYLPVLRGLAFIHVTLTVKNPQMGDLRDTIKAMNRGLKNLLKRDPWVRFVKGMIKDIEVTKGEDGLPHPHIHLILAVPKWYFSSRYYIKQVDWVEVWRDVMGLDYTPVVHVQKVKASKKQIRKTVASLNIQIDREIGVLVAGVVEATKYDTKPAGLIDDPVFLYGLTDQITGMRFHEATGVFKGIFSNPKEGGEGGEKDVDDDELLLKRESSEGEKLTGYVYVFNWHVDNYYLHHVYYSPPKRE